LLGLIEEDVPVLAEDIWAVGARAKNDKFVVCALRRSELATLAPGTLALTPEYVPGFVDAHPALFNLLTGEFEPRPIRRARLRGHALAAAATLLCACLFALGLSRRADVWHAGALTVRQSSRSIVDSLALSVFWTKDDLTMELMQRRQAIPGEVHIPGDASLTLASIIAHWPTEMAAKTQSISATGDSASLSVTVPGDPTLFLAALKTPEGWRLEEPRLAATEKATRLTLELRRSAP